MASEISALLPCPFCGEKAVLHGGEEYAWVACKGCGTETVGDDTTAADAITAWNHRSPAAALPHLVGEPVIDSQDTRQKSDSLGVVVSRWLYAKKKSIVPAGEIALLAGQAGLHSNFVNSLLATLADGDQAHRGEGYTFEEIRRAHAKIGTSRSWWELASTPAPTEAASPDDGKPVAWRWNPSSWVYSEDRPRYVDNPQPLYANALPTPNPTEAASPDDGGDNIAMYLRGCLSRAKFGEVEVPVSYIHDALAAIAAANAHAEKAERERDSAKRGNETLERDRNKWRSEAIASEAECSTDCEEPHCPYTHFPTKWRERALTAEARLAATNPLSDAGALFYAVTSPTGLHIGLWPDRNDAENVAKGYEGSTVTPLRALTGGAS